MNIHSLTESLVPLAIPKSEDRAAVFRVGFSRNILCTILYKMLPHTFARHMFATLTALRKKIRPNIDGDSPWSLPREKKNEIHKEDKDVHSCLCMCVCMYVRIRVYMSTCVYVWGIAIKKKFVP